MPYKCFGILQRALWMQNALNWQHYAEYAESAYNKGSFEVADNLIRLALSCAASFADGDYRYISTLEHLGDVLVARSKAHDACENYTRAYNLLKKFHGLASLNALRLQIKYGRVLIELGKLSEAKSVLAEAQNTCSSYLDVPVELTVFIEAHLRRVRSLQQTIPNAVKLVRNDIEQTQRNTYSRLKSPKSAVTRNSLTEIKAVPVAVPAAVSGLNNQTPLALTS